MILFCCVLAYIRPGLSFDCLLSRFSLLEGYWMYNRMWMSFFFHLLCPCYSVLLQKRSEMSRAHLRCTVKTQKLSHLIYLMNFNNVVIHLMATLLVDAQILFCIIKQKQHNPKWPVPVFWSSHYINKFLWALFLHLCISLNILTSVVIVSVQSECHLRYISAYFMNLQCVFCY